MAVSGETPLKTLRTSIFLFFSLMTISNSYAAYNEIDTLARFDDVKLSEGSKNDTGFDHNTYMRGISGELETGGFEYMLDYYNNKSRVVMEYFDEFDPENITKLVTDRAADWNTTPNQFLEEMADLLSLGEEQRSETKGNYGVDPEKRLQFLMKKYNVSAECSTPDCVSLSRLELVFPHLGVIGQKPLSAQTVVVRSDGDRQEIMDVHSNLLGNPRFGGLIPSNFRGTFGEMSKIIITVHLYYSADVLYRNESVPLRTQCLMLNRRMKKSMLHDARRIRLLEHYNVLSGSQSESEDIYRAYKHLPDDYKNSIPFSIFRPDF